MSGIPFASYMANVVKDPAAWKIASSLIRDGNRAPANKVVYETIVQNQFVKSGAWFGAGIFEVIGGKFINIVVDPSRAVSKFLERVSSFASSVLAFAKRISTAPEALIVIGGMILVVVGGVVTYQWWMAKPAAIEGGPVDPPAVNGAPSASSAPLLVDNDMRPALNASTFDLAANLTWVKQIRQAEMAQGTKFVDDLPSCIVCEAAPPRVVCTRENCGALVLCSEHLPAWKDHQGDICPCCQQSTTFLTIRLAN
eukprot:TRINITY_DN1127_c0_g1_i3.p1 TRINITY_DN1127_c0_g1~~TRINITY_DN1127_c0_g1_i3.p1  ORF type:complete len:254 (-),score=44.52 TRINITY_DN1127_c0_g1_i3:178-939(-)